MLSFFMNKCMLACRCIRRRMRMYLRYRIHLQSVASLSPGSQLELQALLSEAHGLSSNYSPDYHGTDEVYLVTHQSKIVACVFLNAVDWCPVPKQNPVPSLEYSRTEADSNEMLKFCNVRALSVSPHHRRLGIASTLIKLVQRKASADRMLWIELHVDEKKDKSHEWLLFMYRQLDFVVLPRPQLKEYLVLYVNY